MSIEDELAGVAGAMALSIHHLMLAMVNINERLLLHEPDDEAAKVAIEEIRKAAVTLQDAAETMTKWVKE